MLIVWEPAIPLDTRSHAAPLTHLGDAHKLGVGPRVVEAKRDVDCLFGVEDELLEFVRRAAGFNLAVEITVRCRTRREGGSCPPPCKTRCSY